jgi:hypothetical protein
VAPHGWAKAKPAAPRPATLSAPPEIDPARIVDKEAPLRPVFTGRWKLDLSRSVMGKFPGQPQARTDSIEQGTREIVQRLYLVLASGRDTTVYRYRPDADPTVNRVDTQTITSKVTWEQDALHLVSKTKLLVFDMTLDERWRLSANRDTLVMTRTVKSPVMSGDQRLVFVPD